MKLSCSQLCYLLNPLFDELRATPCCKQLFNPQLLQLDNVHLPLRCKLRVILPVSSRLIYITCSCLHFMHVLGDECFNMLHCRVGIELSSVEVRFDNLKIEADIAVGARGNPTVTNSFRNLAEVRACAVRVIASSSYSSAGLYN